MKNAPQTTDPHPWYGPCDALAPFGKCSECLKSAPETEQLRAKLDGLYEEHQHAYARVDEIEVEMGQVRARMAALGYDLD